MIKDKRKKFDYFIQCCKNKNLSVEERQEYFLIKKYSSKWFCIQYKSDIENLTKYRQIDYLINDIQFSLYKKELKNGIYSNN